MASAEISVVMTTYNGARFIREQLESVLAQTVLPSEIVIVDDRSTDSTFEILQEYAADYSFIRIFRNNQRVGAHQNFRKAFMYASCPIIAPSDQDDVWDKNHLKTMLELLIGKNVDFVYSQDKVLWEDGSTSDYYQEMPPMRDLIWCNRMRGHTFLFRKKMLIVFQRAEYLPFDHALALEACMGNNFGHSNEVLTLWRRHKSACTTAFSSNSELVIEDVPRRKKLMYAFLHLSDEKSLPIQRNFEQIAAILSAYSSYRRYYKVCKSMAKQTRMSMLWASISNACIQKYDGNMKSRIAHLLWAMRYPWIFWYDMHKLHAL